MLSHGENFLEITGDDSRFAWRFDPPIFNACGNELCDIEVRDLFAGTMALPAGSFRFAHDENDDGMIARPMPSGNLLSGSITWHVDDNTRNNRGHRRSAAGSMEISGLLTTVDGSGRTLFTQTLTGSGTFEAEVRRRHGDVVSAEVDGEFTGTLTPDHAITAMPEPGAAGLVVLGLAAIVVWRRFGPRRA